VYEKSVTLCGARLAICLGALALPCFAQTATSSDAQNEPPAQKQNLGNWWQKSSLYYHPVSERFLAHVDGTLAYSESQGNTTGSTFNGKLDLSLRKARFTARSTGWLMKQNIVYGFNAGSAHVTQDLLREQINYDLTPHSSLLAGVEDYAYTLIFMNDRFTEYGGYGVGLLADTKQKLNLVGAMGYSQFGFDRASMLGIPSPIIHAAVLALPTTSPSGAGAMAMESYRLELPHQLTLNENGSYMKFVDSYLGHQAMVGVTLDVPFSKHVGFQPGYQLIDQDNQIIDALQVKTEDRVLSLGLKLAW
jgi:hypothetical protein